jgi:hypothetical protein
MFFLTVQAQKDLEVSFQQWVYSYKQAQKIKENYKLAPNFYRKHSKEDCKHAIETLGSAGGLQRRGGATPIPVGDKTTWLSGGLHCHSVAAEDPHAEENARTKLGVEHGADTNLARIVAARCCRRREDAVESQNLQSSRTLPL